LDIDAESTTIIDSINKTIDDYKENSKSCRSEEDLQLRLYQNICNNLGDDSFRRVSSEFSVYTNKQKKKNREYSKKHGEEKGYLKNILNSTEYKLYPKNKAKKIFNDIIKIGMYDLIVFDETEDKIKHIIEIKKLADSEIHPEMANRHRSLEDIFELTDFIKKGYENRSDKLDDKCRAYNLVFVKDEHENKKRNRVDFKKIKTFLSDILQAYENAGIYYIAIGFDKKLKDKAEKEGIELKDIRWGKS